MLKRLLLLGLVSVIALNACGGGTPAAKEDPTLKFGTLPILDMLPLYVAEAEGYFETEGISVELVTATSAAERDQLMQAGQIDVMVSDLVATVLHNKDTQKIAAVRLARAVYPGAAQFSILAAKDSGIKTAADLKGVEIGISQATVIDYVVTRLLERQGLAASDIRTTNVPKIPDRMNLLASGQLKAACLPEPLASLAMQQGAAVIVDDTLAPEISVSVVSFSVETLEARPNTARAFLRAWEKAVEAINADPGKYQNLVVEKKLVPPPVQGSYQLPPYPEKSLPTQAQFEDVMAWMKGRGLLSADVPYGNLVDGSYLPK